tara:strand:- start:17205 stop:17630 length:426 start_codon:yes stop_codon:yes gene_type:complete
MIKKSVVKQAQANGTWDGKFGTMYKHEIAFENGDSGEYSSKDQNQTKFVVGQETEYEFIDGKYPKVKPINNWQPNAQASTPKQLKDDVQEYIIKQSTLKCATDYVIANGGDERRVIEVAEMFTNWVLKGDKPQEQPQDMPF